MQRKRHTEHDGKRKGFENTLRDVEFLGTPSSGKVHAIPPEYSPFSVRSDGQVHVDAYL